MCAKPTRRGICVAAVAKKKASERVCRCLVLGVQRPPHVCLSLLVCPHRFVQRWRLVMVLSSLFKQHHTCSLLARIRRCRMPCDCCVSLSFRLFLDNAIRPVHRRPLRHHNAACHHMGVTGRSLTSKHPYVRLLGTVVSLIPAVPISIALCALVDTSHRKPRSHTLLRWRPCAFVHLLRCALGR